MIWPLETASLSWLVHHPRIVLHRVLGLVRNRSVRSALRNLLVALSLSTSESLAGVVTEGNVTDVPDRYPDAVAYQPISYLALPALLSHINSEDIFVDLGCGKGRVLWFVARRSKLRRIVGIEIVPELAQIARQNMAKCRLVTPVTVVEGDASETDLGEGTVYFLYNPFGEKTLRRVLQNIRNSLRTHPRSIRILYYDPAQAQILDEAGWLRAEQRRGYFRVWKNAT